MLGVSLAVGVRAPLEGRLCPVQNSGSEQKGENGMAQCRDHPWRGHGVTWAPDSCEGCCFLQLNSPFGLIEQGNPVFRDQDKAIIWGPEQVIQSLGQLLYLYLQWA